MSSKEDYQAKISSIEAVSNDDMKSPNMPVDVFLQEAENMYHWCQSDKDKLIGAGLDWKLVEDLPVRAGALRESQSRWFNARFTREAAPVIYKNKTPANSAKK